MKRPDLTEYLLIGAMGLATLGAVALTVQGWF